jgi:anaerobic magnesium-protoporphyrin IX monomethyl ester cyclase
MDNDCGQNFDHADLVLLKPANETPAIKHTNYANLSMIGETLGLASICSNVRVLGYSVYYLDAYFEELSIEETVADIVRRAPVVVGILLRYPCVNVVNKITRALRSLIPKSTLVVGGQFPSINATYVLDLLPDVDGVCIGEGENAIAELLSVGGDSSKCSGRFLWRAKGQIASLKPSTPSRSSVSSLDGLAWPDRKYLKKSQEFGYGAVGITSSRGCPFRCAFCVPHAYSQIAVNTPWNYRSAKSIVDEIQHHYDNGERSFTFSDEHFLPNRMAQRRAHEFATMMIERGLHEAKFMFDCRADSVERELFSQLAKAGLYRVFIGFEAAKNGLLDEIRKDQSVETYANSIKILRDLNIEVIPGMIVFTPTTTIEDIRANLEFYAENFATFSEEDYISDLEVISNTPIAEALRAQGLLTGLVNGVHSWKFRDPIVALIWNDFNELLSKRAKDVRSLGNTDKKSIRELKIDIEADLFSILDRRSDKNNVNDISQVGTKPPGQRYVSHTGFSSVATQR